MVPVAMDSDGVNVLSVTTSYCVYVGEAVGVLLISVGNHLLHGRYIYI